MRHSVTFLHVHINVTKMFLKMETNRMRRFTETTGSMYKQVSQGSYKLLLDSVMSNTFFYLSESVFSPNVFACQKACHQAKHRL